MVEGLKCSAIRCADLHTTIQVAFSYQQSAFIFFWSLTADD